MAGNDLADEGERGNVRSMSPSIESLEICLFARLYLQIHGVMLTPETLFVCLK